MTGRDPLKHAVKHFGKLTPASGGAIKPEGKISPDARSKLAILAEMAGYEVA